MKCSHARSVLMDYQDGLLRETRVAELERHLDECARCRGELGALRATACLLEGLPELPSDSGLTAAVMARIRTRETQPYGVRAWAAMGPVIGIGGIALVAACAMVLLSIPFAAYAPALLGLEPLAGEAVTIGGPVGRLVTSLIQTSISVIRGPLLWVLVADIGLLAALAVTFNALAAISRRRTMVAGGALLPI